jgi:hypothetical protein
LLVGHFLTKVYILTESIDSAIPKSLVKIYGREKGDRGDKGE